MLCEDRNRERDYGLVAEYLSGDSMAVIGRRHGLSRERIRQILRLRRTASRGHADERNNESDFWNLVTVLGPDDCWEWQGHRNAKTGYGAISWQGAKTYTHRLALQLSRGIPASRFVLHHCDNPPCCNPYHLYAGTQADNVRDRETRGRGRYARMK